MVNDVSRAFSHAKVKRDVYVALPEEDKLAGDEGKCAKLEYSLYGTRCSDKLAKGGGEGNGQMEF